MTQPAVAGSSPAARRAARRAWRAHSLGLLPLARAARSTSAVISGWQRMVMESEKRTGSFIGLGLGDAIATLLHQFQCGPNFHVRQLADRGVGLEHAGQLAKILGA